MTLRVFLLLFLFAHPASALSPEAAAHLYIDHQPVPTAPEFASQPEAQAWQNAFVMELSKSWGPTIGYKAALTNPQVQRQLGISNPILGVLLRDMLLKDDAEIAADFATRPLVEADLLVRVRDASINDAETDLQMLDALDAAIPFIELADLAYATNVTLNGLNVLAVNAGARAGVLGEEISFAGGSDWMRRLAFFTVELRNGNDELLASAGGGALLGHPLQAVRWIRDTLKARGQALKSGDLLSLGSLTPPRALDAGETYIATYVNLDPNGPVSVQVRVRTNAR